MENKQTLQQRKRKKLLQHKDIFQIIPGIAASFFVVLLGIYGAQWIGHLLVQWNILPEGSSTPISSIFVAILLGLIIRNTIGIHSTFMPGISFSLKYALRAGIILLGLKLSIVEALKLGAWGIPLIIVSISCGLGVTLLFTKWLNQSRRLGTLIASGTGICGVTAIMTLSPVVKAKDNEISYAIANITIFGLIGMLLYPYIAFSMFDGDPIKAGLFLGTAIHDTAQVAGAALIYHQIYDVETVVNVATVTKLTRNLFMIIVIPLVAYFFYKNNNQSEASSSIPKWYQLIPLFIIGFLLLAVLRTIGDLTVFHQGLAFGLLHEHTWHNLYTSLSSFGTTYLLGLAMASVGLSTDFSMFKGIGMKPFYIGFIAAISVGVVSLLMVSFFGHLVSL